MKKHSTQINPLQWLWLVPLLLALTAIVAPRLGRDGLWYDEIFSVMNAKGEPYGPVSIDGIWTQVSQNDPHQALGYPYMLAIWGSAVGWTEFALRAFSLLAAVLAVSVTYQLGKRLVSMPVGLFAALVLAISTYFVHYAHENRSFTFVALAAACLLWSYHHLLYAEMMPKRLQVLFVLSGMALLWSHYYAGILIFALGLYHLFFVKKDKRWLQITGLAVLIALLFLPEIPSALKGYNNYSPSDVEIAPLSAWAVLETLVYFIGNNAAIITVLAFVLGLAAAWESNHLRMLIIVSIFSMIVLLISNEILGILEPARLRYVVFLWPLFAIWVAAGLLYLIKLIARYQSSAARVLLVLLGMFWVINGIYANYQWNFNDLIAGDRVPRLRLISNIFKEKASPSDILVFYNGSNQDAFYMRFGLEYAFTNQIPQWLFASNVMDESVESTRLWAREQIANSQRVWYGVNRRLPIEAYHEDFVAYISQDFVSCGTYLDEWDISLDLYARSLVFCPSNANLAQFGAEFTLNDYEYSLNEDTIHFNLNWELSEGTQAENYSLGIYVMPKGVLEVLTQTDIGFATDTHVLMSHDMNIGDLVAGEYDIWLAVNQWKSSERLTLGDGSSLWLMSSFEKD